MRSILCSSLLLLSTLSACKEKGQNAAPSPSAPPAPLAAAAPTAVTTVTSARPATLPQGKPAFGCFAWSAEAKAAACVTGQRGFGVESDVALTYVGSSEKPTKLGSAVDAKTVSAIDDVLARKRYLPLGSDKKVLSAEKPLETGTVKLTWTERPTRGGGDNEAPHHETKVVAKCAGREVVLLQNEIEGGDPKVSARAVGEHVIVELAINVSREGENSDRFDAFVLDAATCTVSRK
jgi:hypothetical protein